MWRMLNSTLECALSTTWLSVSANDGAATAPSRAARTTAGLRIISRDLLLNPCTLVAASPGGQVKRREPSLHAPPRDEVPGLEDPAPAHRPDAVLEVRDHAGVVGQDADPVAHPE